MTANASRTMLPLQSLLNPSPSEPTTRPQRTTSTAIPSPSRSDITAGSLSTLGETAPARDGKSELPNILTKAKPRGPVNYHPFEDLEGSALKTVLGFQVTPFGHIHKDFQHIPYSSSKKDLFEKTGRESIEAFRYEFRVPGHDRVYVVMWDYNIGIVRMNPFIKWGGFPKTKSSQMLDKNPGLRNISPGITGGAVTAQGYWVPYRCARALCATFCYPIAGALIPLFGPTFPADCIPPESPAYNEMLISRPLLADDARQAEIARRYHMNRALAARDGVTSHPRPDHGNFREPSRQVSFTTQAHAPTHVDINWSKSGTAQQYWQSSKIATPDGAGLHEYMITSHPGIRFTPANLPSPEENPFEKADPYLSAMPQRVTPVNHHRPGSDTESPWTAKRRRLNHLGPQHRRESTAPQLNSPSPRSAGPARSKKETSAPRSLAHYNAAMVLVALSSKEGAAATGHGTDPTSTGTVDVAPGNGFHNMRQRARSF